MAISRPDPCDLERFVDAQATSYAQALAELRAGRKDSHWIWYVFPQIRGLGWSERSIHYALSGLDEARAYLDHPLLGARRRECVTTMNAHAERSAAAILGSLDAQKFHSCVTLFARVAEPGSPFHAALARHFECIGDAGTLRILAADKGGRRR